MGVYFVVCDPSVRGRWVFSLLPGSFAVGGLYGKYAPFPLAFFGQPTPGPFICCKGLSFLPLLPPSFVSFPTSFREMTRSFWFSFFLWSQQPLGFAVDLRRCLLAAGKDLISCTIRLAGCYALSPAMYLTGLTSIRRSRRIRCNPQPLLKGQHVGGSLRLKKPLLLFIGILSDYRLTQFPLILILFLHFLLFLLICFDLNFVPDFCPLFRILRFPCPFHQFCLQVRFLC